MQEETELAALLAADVRGHFRLVVERYQHRIYAFAYRLSGNAAEAEDIAQDAFVRAYLACMGYPRERVASLRLRPWLYKIALNEFRHRTRGSRLHLVPLDLSEQSPALSVQDEGRRPDLLLEYRERLQELEQAVAQLPERYRAPIVCFYFERMPYQDIANLLDQPLGTIKSSIFRGVRLLRDAMNAHCQPGKEERPWSRKTSGER